VPKMGGFARRKKYIYPINIILHQGDQTSLWKNRPT
jgi:hypothetical protein